MEELYKAVAAVAAAGLQRATLSGPRAGAAHRRATLRPMAGGWQVERFTDTQAFHQNIGPQALAQTLAGMLEQEFTQLTAAAGGREYSIKISKKGKVLQNSRPLPGAAQGMDQAAGQPPAATPGHDRQKARLIPEGADVPALVDIGVFTADGKVAAAKRDKYRQISRFVELVDDTLPEKAPETLRVVDFGCGKSYLTFVLYHYLTAVRGITVQMTGLDLRPDVVATCNAAAGKYGYQGLRFQVGDIAGYTGVQRADMVVTLHACDTATDEALARAVAWGAGIILSVPCCQHQLRGQMHSDELAILSRYGIVKERAAALMTDAIRANLLAACGYKAQLLEFVEMEHTAKNIMIRAVKRPLSAARRQQALEEVHRLCAAFGFQPKLLELLRENGAL